MGEISVSSGAVPMPVDVRLAGRYHLRGPLGAGGMGTVWLALDNVTDKDVAVKEISLPAGLSEAERTEETARIIREVKAAAAITHPGMVTIHDVIKADGRPWIVMDRIVGRTLEQVLAEERTLSPERVAQIGFEALLALATAHSHGVV